MQTSEQMWISLQPDHREVKGVLYDFEGLDLYEDIMIPQISHRHIFSSYLPQTYLTVADTQGKHWYSRPLALMGMK